MFSLGKRLTTTWYVRVELLKACYSVVGEDTLSALAPSPT